MNLPFHYSLAEATKVLAKTRVVLRKVKCNPKYHTYFSVESYVNCREQGYTILGSVRAKEGEKGIARDFYCSIAQQRNSDSIILYIASYEQAHKISNSYHPSRILKNSLGNASFRAYHPFTGNIPTEEVYCKSISKPYKQYKDAADYIAKEIASFLSCEYKTSTHFFGDYEIIEQQKRYEKEEAA